MTDPADLWLARVAVRNAYHTIQRLHADPVLSRILNRLDQICCDITAETDRIQPKLDLRSVRVIEIREGAPG